MKKSRSTILTREEIETPRTAAEFKTWVDHKIDEVGELEKAGHTVQFSKELREECLPLAIFCERYFKLSTDVRIQHCIGSQNFDARIFDDRIPKSPLEYIEITQAHEGEDAHLRMECLKEHGHVSALGPVTKSGTRRRGRRIEVESTTERGGDTDNKILERVSQAANRKSGKDYPSNTGLIIAFDDFVRFKETGDVESLRKHVQESLLSGLGNFSRVFIVGKSSRVYLEFDPGEFQQS